MVKRMLAIFGYILVNICYIEGFCSISGDIGQYWAILISYWCHIGQYWVILGDILEILGNMVQCFGDLG
jgi:hypothetical protein